MKVTLSKGGTAERSVELSQLVIPDLWHLAQALPEPDRGRILETWYIAHDLKRELEDAQYRAQLALAHGTKEVQS